jgi:L-type amino acid transporter 5
MKLQGSLSVAMLVINDVYILINYVCFVEALAMGVTVLGLLWLRYTNPTAHRPIKVMDYKYFNVLVELRAK